jgi:Cu(I)/Ag(I) efflux system membrane fusion protein
MMKTSNKNILKALGILLLGLLLGWLLFGGTGQQEADHVHTGEVESKEVIWTCSMHPEIRRNEPGACPICGMDLIPLETEEAGTDPETYQMSETAMKLANVSTSRIEKTAPEKQLRLNGKVQVDERRSFKQISHIPGRVEKLQVAFTGEKVNRGQTLATIYSPELVNAQEELLQAAEIKESQPELFEASKEKLRNWRIGESQIQQIIEKGRPIQQFPVRADVSGVVTKKMVELGDYVERGMPVYEIADLSKVWVLFDLYESDLAWVKEGSRITYTIRSFPGETFEGKIDFIDPVIDPQTRVATARVEVENKNGRLKPEMFASGVIKTELGQGDRDEIVIPKSAVLWTGKRSVVYIKKTLNGKAGFTLREVILGAPLGDAYIVEEGLELGDEVVTNGAFTIDAAVQLSGRRSMMNPTQEVKEKLQPLSLTEKEKEMFQKLIEQYMKVAEHLAADDFMAAKEKMISTNKTIMTIDEMQLSQDTKAAWERLNLQLRSRSTQLATAKDIAAMRDGFAEFSAEMIMLAEVLDPMEARLYVQHCPMAEGDKGADWLSLSREISNPYFGSAMLRCGETTREIK